MHPNSWDETKTFHLCLDPLISCVPLCSLCRDRHYTVFLFCFVLFLADTQMEGCGIDGVSEG